MQGTKQALYSHLLSGKFIFMEAAVRYIKAEEILPEEVIALIQEYADGNSERGKKMRQTICEKFKFASLGFQTIEGVVNAIGLEPCKLCTYCWTGKE